MQKKKNYCKKFMLKINKHHDVVLHCLYTDGNYHMFDPKSSWSRWYTVAKLIASRQCLSFEYNTTNHLYQYALRQHMPNSSPCNNHRSNRRSHLQQYQNLKLNSSIELSINRPTQLLSLSPSRQLYNPVCPRPYQKLHKRPDFVLHCPYTDDNHHMFDPKSSRNRWCIVATLISCR